MGQVDGLTLSEKNVEFVGADLAAERRPDSPTQQPFIRRLSALSTTHRCFPLDQSHSHTLSSPTQSASSPCFSCFPLHVTLSLWVCICVCVCGSDSGQGSHTRPCGVLLEPTAINPESVDAVAKDVFIPRSVWVFFFVSLSSVCIWRAVERWAPASFWPFDNIWEYNDEYDCSQPLASPSLLSLPPLAPAHILKRLGGWWSAALTAW